MNPPCSFIKGCSEAKCQQRYYFPRMQNEHRWQIRFCKTFRDLHYYIYSEFIIIHNTHPCLCSEYLTWKYEMASHGVPINTIYRAICCDKANRSLLFSTRVDDLRQDERQQRLAMQQSWAEHKMYANDIWV